MSAEIVFWLVQDGVTNGAIYALIALALLIVFSVTRVIFVPQGELITFSAMSFAMLEGGKTPGTIYILVIAGVAAALLEAVAAARQRAWRALPRTALIYVALPMAVALVVAWVAPQKFDKWILVAVTLIMSVPLGPILYRLAYQPLAQASILALFIASIAVHYVLVGLALVFFGGEGLRAQAMTAKVSFGAVHLAWQNVQIVLASLSIMLALWLFFERFVYGKALRAAAMNRIGARLVGIPTEVTGHISFVFAAFVGAITGVLIAPTTTIYYDTGFLIALKGFVGAILGGMASYPLSVVGSVVIGLVESFSSFWASVFKETIVFTLILPMLAWLSLRSRHVEDEEENG